MTTLIFLSWSGPIMQQRVQSVQRFINILLHIVKLQSRSNPGPLNVIKIYSAANLVNLDRLTLRMKARMTFNTNYTKHFFYLITGSRLTQISARVPNLDETLNLNNFGHHQASEVRILGKKSFLSSPSPSPQSPVPTGPKS